MFECVCVYVRTRVHACRRACGVRDCVNARGCARLRMLACAASPTQRSRKKSKTLVALASEHTVTASFSIAVNHAASTVDVHPPTPQPTSPPDGHKKSILSKVRGVFKAPKAKDTSPNVSVPNTVDASSLQVDTLFPLVLLQGVQPPLALYPPKKRMWHCTPVRLRACALTNAHNSRNAHPRSHPRPKNGHDHD